MPKKTDPDEQTAADALQDHAPASTAAAEVENPEFREAVEKATPKSETAQPKTGLDYPPGVYVLYSKSFHGNQEISDRVAISEARNEDYLWNLFRTSHPDAIRPDFAVKKEGEIDPDLKTDTE